ncbi:hypothetical protein F4779DRAFT_506892 [Xylariaceae sp. FL0662B]|nr:hypothetical protein F4779DRAFT_506892 [Xylariaceae sp. FL0662B]
MTATTFFAGWELWEQMTFVLAASIVCVFIAGLVKLWWLSRYLKKHTVLDAEKRARQEVMQRSGLPVSRKIDIPFGVRAIQSGIEVDGIWISQPGTPIEVGANSPLLKPLTGVDIESDPKGKEKDRIVFGGVLEPTATVLEVQPTPGQSLRPSPTASLLERNSLVDIEPASLRTPPGPPSTYRPKHSSQHLPNNTSNAGSAIEALDQLEGNTGRHQQLETYVPTNSSSNVHSSRYSHPKRPVQRNSSSSDEGPLPPNTHYVSHMRRSAGPLPLPRSPFDDSEPPLSNIDDVPNTYAEPTRNPFETPDSERSSVSRPPLAARKPIPRRSYSGDTYVNTSSRRVNAGFEILPAGTFSISNSETDVESGQSGRTGKNKLQKKSRDRSSSRGQ